MAKTVKELKEKMINAIDEVDLSKLSSYELSTLAYAVKSIGEIKDEGDDTFSLLSKNFCETGFRAPTLQNLKERE